MNNDEIFRRKFIELEKLTINEEDNDSKLAARIKELKNKRKNPYYSDYDFIDFCRLCRNRLAHNGYENDFIVYTDEMIKKLDNIIYQIKNPYTAYDKATKKLTTARITDNVREIMTIMKDKNYTHIPVYKEKQLVGVFSESSLFNYLYKEKIIEIDEKTIFTDILDYIKVENSSEEVRFVDRNKLYDDVVNEFVTDFNKGSKLSCVMITQNGKNTEYVLGLITTWDVIGR